MKSKNVLEEHGVGREWQEGWMCWGVIAHSTGNPCLVLEAGTGSCCGLGMDFTLPAASLHSPTLMVPECLYSWLCLGTLSLATFSLPAKLCQATDCEYSCPEVSEAVYLYALSMLSGVSLF